MKDRSRTQTKASKCRRTLSMGFVLTSNVSKRGSVKSEFVRMHEFVRRSELVRESGFVRVRELVRKSKLVRKGGFVMIRLLAKRSELVRSNSDMPKRYPRNRPNRTKE